MNQNLERLSYLPVSEAPKPFPGQYPTRVNIKGLIPGGRFSYVGKPTEDLPGIIRKHFFLKGGRIQDLWSSEFDQNGYVTVFSNRVIQRASFANLYRPFPPWVNDELSSVGRLAFCLVGKTIEIEGRKMYAFTPAQAFPWRDRFERMMQECAKGKIRQDWWTQGMGRRMAIDLIPVLERWAALPQTRVRAPLPTGIVEGTDRTALVHELPRQVAEDFMPAPVDPIIPQRVLVNTQRLLFDPTVFQRLNFHNFHVADPTGAAQAQVPTGQAG